MSLFVSQGRLRLLSPYVHPIHTFYSNDCDARQQILDAAKLQTFESLYNLISTDSTMTRA